MDERFAHRDKAGASFNSIGAKGKSSRKCARIGNAAPRHDRNAHPIHCQRHTKERCGQRATRG
jgi:hypothetical protein